MKRKFVLLVGLALWLALTASASAQSAGGYDLERSAVTGGGDLTPGGGGYTLMDGVAVPGDGAPLSGGGYELTGGFWVGTGGGADNNIYYYLPIILKNE